jgi:hypothetical protein
MYCMNNMAVLDIFNTFIKIDVNFLYIHMNILNIYWGPKLY